MNNVLLLYGGNSYEHDVSIQSALNIYRNIDKNLFNVTCCYIDKNNKFYIIDDIKKLKFDKEVDNIITFLKNFDVVFNIIHGNDGEDGKLQSLFELFNIKYIGSNHISSMLCMNKYYTKVILNNNKIKQTKYILYDGSIKKIENKLNYPMIVKPCSLGSSIGINKVNNHEELVNAIEYAYRYDNDILIEEFIDGLELECACIYDKKLHISNIGQIKPSNSFYDYQDKYLKQEAITVIPAEIAKKTSDKIRSITKKVFNILKCKDLVRIDYLYDKNKNIIYLNEINTLPGFTNISMYPLLLMFDGYTYKDILTTLINNNINP